MIINGSFIDSRVSILLSSSPSPAFFQTSIDFSKSLNLNTKHKHQRLRICKAMLLTNPEDFEVGRLVGSYGFMNITSYSAFQPGGLDDDVEYVSNDMERLRVQDVGEGQVKIRLYEGRIAQGLFRGTRVIFKVYPGKRAGGTEAVMMAANELNTHASLQSGLADACQNIQILVGGFETKTGEQWLAFRNHGKSSAADYAKIKSESLSKDSALGVWNPFDKEQKIKRRRLFVIRLLRGIMSGLAYMHYCDRLHQSLGPASVILNTTAEREAAYLIPRLRDLAFSVDIRYSVLEERPGSLSEGLWRRASAAGAFDPLDKRAFGIADDIYEAGLLFAYLAFVPFCEAGTMDGLSLQRLLESTFRLDLDAAREYENPTYLTTNFIFQKEVLVLVVSFYFMHMILQLLEYNFRPSLILDANQDTPMTQVIPQVQVTQEEVNRNQSKPVPIGTPIPTRYTSYS